MTNTSIVQAEGRDGLPCPTCRVGLVMSERQGIEIDYCPKCRGVWLDRGKLDRIIERSAPADSGTGQPSPEPRQYGGHGSGHGGRGYGGHRRNFLGRLFD